MRAYLWTTGVVFGLIALAHVLRVVLEDPHLAVEPWFAGSTVLAAALCVWASRLLWTLRRSS